MTILEGFFGTPPAARAAKVFDDTQYREALMEKLVNFRDISDDEWEYINTRMDGCVKASSHGMLKRICNQAIIKYGDNVSLNWIDVSERTYMAKIFQNQTDFNGDISSWDVSNAVTLGWMFEGCERFNGDLSSWDVSSAEDLEGMFYKCRKFAGDLSSWDVSNVTEMGKMFEGCERFDCDLSGWDTSQVYSMDCMFFDCLKFNHDISGWDVNKVRYHDDVFSRRCIIPERKCPNFKR